MTNYLETAKIKNMPNIWGYMTKLVLSTWIHNTTPYQDNTQQGQLHLLQPDRQYVRDFLLRQRELQNGVSSNPYCLVLLARSVQYGDDRVPDPQAARQQHMSLRVFKTLKVGEPMDQDGSKGATTSIVLYRSQIIIQLSCCVGLAVGATGPQDFAVERPEAYQLVVGCCWFLLVVE
eukprot:6314264-Amphidinium_carterae.1